MTNEPHHDHEHAAMEARIKRMQHAKSHSEPQLNISPFVKCYVRRTEYCLDNDAEEINEQNEFLNSINQSLSFRSGNTDKINSPNSD